MSNAASTNVWANSKQKGSKLLILLAIADNADDYGFAYPGETFLKEKTRMSIRQNRRLLTELADAGEIYVHEPETTGRGHKKGYLILTGLDRDQVAERVTNCLGFSKEEADRVADNVEAKKGDKLSKGGQVVKRGTFSSKKGDISKSKKLPVPPVADKPKRPEVVPTTIEPYISNNINTGFSPELWNEYIQAASILYSDSGFSSGEILQRANDLVGILMGVKRDLTPKETRLFVVRWKANNAVAANYRTPKKIQDIFREWLKTFLAGSLGKERDPNDQLNLNRYEPHELLRLYDDPETGAPITLGDFIRKQRQKLLVAQ